MTNTKPDLSSMSDDELLKLYNDRVPAGLDDVAADSMRREIEANPSLKKAPEPYDPEKHGPIVITETGRPELYDPEKHGAIAPSDLSSMSDDELKRRYYGSMSAEELMKHVRQAPQSAPVAQNDPWAEFSPKAAPVAQDDQWADFKPKAAPTNKSDSGSLVGDVLADAGHVAGGHNAVRHPADTADAMWQLTKGVASKLIGQSGRDAIIDAKGEPPEVAALDKEIERQKKARDERALDTLVDQKKADYGSLEAAGHTALHKPFSTLLDLSSVLAPAASLPGRVGATAGVLSDVTNVPGQAIRLAAKPIGMIGDYARSAAKIDPSIIAKRQAQSQQYGIPLTQGQVSGDASLLSKEDNMRYGRDGQAPKVMKEFDGRQDEAIANATDGLRSGMTGQPAAMTPAEIGDTLSDAYKSTALAAKRAVTAKYDAAFDPQALAKAGVESDLPIEAVYGLKNKIEDSFLHPDRPGGLLVPTDATAPNTMAALKMLDQFSETGGIGSAFNKVTRPPNGPLPGDTAAPTVSGISWQQMDLVRKMLNGLRSGARANPTDLAGMRRVMDVFDEELGKRNPLLNHARSAHQARVSVFDPQRTNAQGVNPILKTLANDNNPGQLIYNKLFNGTAMKNGEAGPIVDALKAIVGNNPQAVQALREGMLNRLFEKDGSALSPKKTATAISKSLEGAPGQVYAQLFSPRELAKLSDYGDLLDHVGTTRTAQNASKTSYNFPWLKHRTGAGIAGAAGAALGHATGIPYAGEAGLMAGAAIGSGLDNWLAFARAQKLANGAHYSPPTIVPAIARAGAGGADVLNALSPGVRQLSRLSLLAPPDE
jgi:hypothetical protein